VKVNRENRENIIQAGSPVRTLTPEQRQVWIDALKPVWKKFEEDIGSDLLESALKANNG